MAVRVVSSIIQSGITARGAAINVQIALNDGTSMILQFGADLATQFVATLTEGMELVPGIINPRTDRHALCDSIDT